MPSLVRDYRKITVFLGLLVLFTFVTTACGSSAFDSYTRGVEHNELGQYDAAIQDYDQVIRLDPEYADAYHNRGYSYDEAGQYERAIQDYSEAILLDPQDADAYYNRGVSYHNLGQSAEAERDFAKSEELGTQ